MSHFTVLVVAKDEAELESKLLPYYEYGTSQGMDDLIKPYLEWKKFDEEFCRELFDAYKKDNPESLMTWEQYLEEDGLKHHPEHGWGYWHNPNAKWDWYQIGGRWERVMPNHHVKLGEIDFDLYREQAQLEDPEKALTFAFVNKAGKWIQRAQMGWFAMTSDSNDTYDATFWEFVKAEGDELVYLVDCHI